MRRFLLPIVTALLGALVGPLMVAFPALIFPPLALMVVIGGSPFGAVGGLVLGLGFSLAPSAVLGRLFVLPRFVRLLVVSLFGLLSGAITYHVFRLGLGASTAPWLHKDMALFAYAGATSALALWPVVCKLLLLPNRSSQTYAR